VADTIDITAGAGTTIATDDCAGTHYQVVKLADGTADQTAVIAADVGAKANALRVAPANDITDGTYIGDIKFGEGLPANSGVDIGDVDVTSIVPGTAAANLGKAEDAVHATGDVGIMVLTVRDDAPSTATADEGDYTPLLTNATGHVYCIDPTANALTTTGNTSLAIMDDWDAVSGAAAATDGPQVMGRYDSTKPSAVDDGDAVQLLTDSYGRLLQGVEPQWFQAVYDSADATGEGEVVKASAASTKIVVTSFVISSDVEGWAKLQDEDSNALTGKFWLKAGGGVSWTAGPGAPFIVNTADKDLEIIVEAAGNVSCTVWGYLIPG